MQSLQELRIPVHAGITRDEKPSRSPPYEKSDINKPATIAKTTNNIGRNKNPGNFAWKMKVRENLPETFEPPPENAKHQKLMGNPQ